MRHAGSFSFPNVPPNAELEYDLDLVDFEAVNEVCTSPHAHHGTAPFAAFAGMIAWTLSQLANQRCTCSGMTP